MQAQKAMSEWAWYMVLVSALALVIAAVGVYFVWQTLWEAQNATHIAREVGKRQVRPYIGFHDLNFSFEKADDRDFLDLTLIVKNAGQSPARKVRWRAGWASDDGDFDTNWINELPYAESDGVMNVGETAEMRMQTHEVDDDPDRSLTNEQVAAIKAGQRPFWLFGEVDYLDMFGDPHKYTFRMVTARKRSGISFTVCEEGNDTT